MELANKYYASRIAANRWVSSPKKSGQKKCDSKNKKNRMKIYIKYMVSLLCKLVLKQELKKLGLHFIVVDLGEIEIMEDISDAQREELKNALLNCGPE